MAIRKIARLGEPILRRVAAPVPPEMLRTDALQRLLADMQETMRDANGAGLAAPQVYESLQICMLEVKQNPRYPNFPELPLTILLNPRLTLTEGGAPAQQISVYEGCLSVPGLRGRVTRPASVRLQALTPDGTLIDEIWEGIAAVIVQHEVEHLMGRLFIDSADPTTLCFTPEYERHVPFAQRIVVGEKQPVGS